jgi:chorismate mutase/prephenate dehydratase
MSDSRDDMAHIRAALEQADADLIAALDARARAIRHFVALRDRDPTGYHAIPSTAEVIARARELRKDFPEHGLGPVLREVIGVCAEMIAPVQVAVVGTEGGVAHLAGRRFFGTRAQFRAFGLVAEVFAELERGRVAHAIVPFESSTDGAVSATLQCLSETSAKVIGEITLACSWHLYSRTGNVADIEKVYGAAATLKACERTLKAELPRASLLDVRSGLVAGQLALEDHGAAALGSELLAELGQKDVVPGERTAELRSVRKNLEDDPGLYTRYLVLGSQQPRRTGSDRTMIMLALSEEPGSLYAALQPFAERGINLSRVESRRSMSDERHVFFIELDGHISDRAVLTATDEVKTRARSAKVLGSYPRPLPEPR